MQFYMARNLICGMPLSLSYWFKFLINFFKKKFSACQDHHIFPHSIIHYVQNCLALVSTHGQELVRRKISCFRPKEHTVQWGAAHSSVRRKWHYFRSGFLALRLTPSRVGECPIQASTISISSVAWCPYSPTLRDPQEHKRTEHHVPKQKKTKTKGAFPYDVLKGRYLKHLKHTVPLSFPMASARFCLHCIGHKKKGTAYFQHPRTKQQHNLQCWRTKQTERTFTKGFIELFTVAHRNFMRKR